MTAQTDDKFELGFCIDSIQELTVIKDSLNSSLILMDRYGKTDQGRHSLTNKEYKDSKKIMKGLSNRIDSFIKMES